MLHYDVLQLLLSLSFTTLNICIFTCYTENTPEIIKKDLSTVNRSVIGNCSTKLCRYTVQTITTPIDNKRFNANILISPVLDPVIYVQINVDPKDKISFNSKQNYSELQNCPGLCKKEEHSSNCRTVNKSNCAYHLQPVTMKNDMVSVMEGHNPVYTWIENHKKNNKNLANFIQWLQVLKHADRTGDKSNSKTMVDQQASTDENDLLDKLLVTNTKNRRDRNRPVWFGRNDVTHSIERIKSFLHDSQNGNYEKDKRLSKDYEQNSRNYHDLGFVSRCNKSNRKDGNYLYENNVACRSNDDYEEIALKRLISTVLKPIGPKGKHDISCYNVYPLMRANNSEFNGIQGNGKKCERDTGNTTSEWYRERSSPEYDDMNHGLNFSISFQTRKGTDSRNENNEDRIKSVVRNKNGRRGKKKLLTFYGQNENNYSNITDIPIVYAIVENTKPNFNNNNISSENSNGSLGNSGSNYDFDSKGDSEYYKIGSEISKLTIKEEYDKIESTTSQLGDKLKITKERAETITHTKKFKSMTSTTNSNAAMKTNTASNKKKVTKNGKKQIVKKQMVKNYYYALSKPKKNKSKVQTETQRQIHFNETTLDDGYEDYKKKKMKKAKYKFNKNFSFDTTLFPNDSKSSTSTISEKQTSYVSKGNTLYQTSFRLNYQSESEQTNEFTTVKNRNKMVTSSKVVKATLKSQNENKKPRKFKLSFYRNHSRSTLKIYENISSPRIMNMKNMLNVYSAREDIFTTTAYNKSSAIDETQQYFTEVDSEYKKTQKRIIYNADQKKKTHTKQKHSFDDKMTQSNLPTICEQNSEELIGYSTFTFQCEETTVNLTD